MPDALVECPSAEDYGSYLGGRLDDESSAAIEEHYAECERCRETLRVVDGKLGTVVSPPPADPYVDEPACDRAVALVEDIGRRASERTRLGADIEAGNTIDSSALGDVGHYRLLAKLGEGGMGAVFKALHTNLDRIVALKVLPADALRDPDKVARFGREMRAVGKLRHENIVGAHDAGEVDGVHYLVMELVEGEDLATLVERSGPLPVPEACELVRQAALGLQHAHEHGMVHRDVKPSNLMLDRDGVVKVLDMGLARLSEHLNPAPELTATGQLMGTLDYMAPEQGSDTHGVDIRADVYSLGATLYKLLCGTAPFADRRFDTPIKKLRALAIEEPEPLASRRPDLPAALCKLVHGMLAKEPAVRPATPATVAEALADFTAEADVAGLLVATPTDLATTNAQPDRSVESPASTRNARLTVDRPVSPPTSTAPWWSGPAFLATTLAVVLLPMLVYVVATTFFVQTEYGVIRVEVEGADAEDVDVTVRGTEIVLTGADEKPVHLTPGQKTLHVHFERGGVSFDTAALELKPDDDLTVRIEFRPGEVVAVRDDTGDRIGGAGHSVGAPDERKLAEAILAKGGMVGIVPLPVDDEPGVMHFSEVEDLIDDEFAVVEVQFEKPVSDEDVAVLTHAPHVTSVTAPGSRLTPEAWEHLNTLPQLSKIDVRSSPLSIGETCDAIDRHAQLTHFAVDPREPREADYTSLARMKSLRELSVNTPLTTELARVLAGLPKIESVKTGGTEVTGEALAAFADAELDLPRLELQAVTLTDEHIEALTRIAPWELWLKQCNLSIADAERLRSVPNTRLRLIGRDGAYRWDSRDAPPPAVAPFRTDAARAHQTAWAKHLGEEVVTTNSIGTKLVLVPPGRFLMNQPIKTVEVELHRAYRIGANEITQREWRAVMSTEPWKDGENVLEADDVPATHVNWHDAMEFCKRLTVLEKRAERLPEGWEYRLPTEAEWEHACRAGTEKFYWFGIHDTELAEYAWYEENTKDEPHAHPVGRKRPNPWGLYDMYGNVWEWSFNLYAAHPEGGTDPMGPREGDFEVEHYTLRSSAWHGGSSSCGSHNRGANGSQQLGKSIGFRIALVRSPDEQ